MNCLSRVEYNGESNQSSKIQFLRGLSIIAVVLIHHTPDGLMQVWCRPFLNFTVGCFLFLSGFLSCTEKWNPRKRIMKVTIPYILWSIVYVFIHNYKSISQLPVIFVKQVITGNAAAVMYYIYIYIEFTLLIPAIDRLARSNYKLFGFFISPIEIVSFRLVPIVLGIEMNKYFSLIMRLSCLGWFTYFYLGYLLGNGLLEIKMKTQKLIIMWLCSIILQILEGYCYMNLGEDNCGTQLKLTAILSGTLFVMLSYKFLNSAIVPLTS